MMDGYFFGGCRNRGTIHCNYTDWNRQDNAEYNQGWTYPLGKGRRLPWAPKSQGPPKMLFIFEMRIKLRDTVYYHDNRLRVLVERASCTSCLKQIKILCIWSWRSHEREVSARAHTSHISSWKELRFQLKHRYIASLILHTSIAEIIAQLLSLTYV